MLKKIKLKIKSKTNFLILKEKKFLLKNNYKLKNNFFKKHFLIFKTYTFNFNKNFYLKHFKNYNFLINKRVFLNLTDSLNLDYFNYNKNLTFDFLNSSNILTNKNNYVNLYNYNLIDDELHNFDKEIILFEQNNNKVKTSNFLLLNQNLILKNLIEFNFFSNFKILDKKFKIKYKIFFYYVYFVNQINFRLLNLIIYFFFFKKKKINYFKKLKSINFNVIKIRMVSFFLYIF
jgi:hypothetical protein